MFDQDTNLTGLVDTSRDVHCFLTGAIEEYHDNCDDEEHEILNVLNNLRDANLTYLGHFMYLADYEREDTTHHADFWDLLIDLSMIKELVEDIEDDWLGGEGKEIFDVLSTTVQAVILGIKGCLNMDGDLYGTYDARFDPDSEQFDEELLNKELANGAD